MSDTGDAPVTPRQAATVMLLRDGDPHGLEVLLLRRSGRTPFVPGAHVFPGGAVEPSDAIDEPAWAATATGLDDATAASVLGVDRDGLAFWLAAVRECLEEAGVLLAHDDTGWIADDHHAMASLDELRRAVEDGERHLGEHCVAHGLRIPLDQVAYVARWITPEQSPRRYDTRFFAAPMPPGQTAAPDRWEAVDADWWRPDAALAAWQAGDIDLIDPTVASLRLLAGFSSADRALASFRAGAARPERVLDPLGGERIAVDTDLVGDER